MQVGSSSNWSYIFCGGDSTFGINSGRLYAWGRNDYGQLGNRSFGDVSSPVQIGSLANWFAAVVSDVHTLGIKI